MPAELLLQIRVTDILEKLTHMAMAALYSIVRAVFVDPAFVWWITLVTRMTDSRHQERLAHRMLPPLQVARTI